MRRIKWALAAVGPLLCLALCACGLFELSAFLENLTVYGQTDPDDSDPTLIFVLYWRDGTVQTLLTAGETLEIDGACYRAGAGDCRALNALGWSLLFP